MRTNLALLAACTVAILSTFTLTPSKAQWPDRLKEGIKFYPNSQDSACFIKLNMTSQLWARYTENNPATTVSNVSEVNTTDISIRRIRFFLSGQLTDRIAFFVHFGQNNLNYLSARKTGSFFHDVTTDYAIVKKHLSLGFGLNGWNGPSRLANGSITNLLVLDPPIYQEVTNDTYDQFVRRLGLYAKGKLGKLDYRLSVGKSFSITTTGGITDPLNSKSSTFSTLPPKMAYQGYFSWQFLDQESNFTPSAQGTYLGKKKVVNLGAGFYHQKDAMFQLNPSNTADTLKQAINLLAVDLFYDCPLNKEKGTAISLYTSYSIYDFGSNFIKVTGPNNPANGIQTSTVGSISNYYAPTGAVATSFNKANYGNAHPYLGTGNIFYLQAGYKLRNNLLNDQGTLQSYANVQYANYERLKDAMLLYDLGINWLISGHNAKITFNYQNRPFFSENTAGELVEKSRHGQYTLQYQLAF